METLDPKASVINSKHPKTLEQEPEKILNPEKEAP